MLAAYLAGVAVALNQSKVPPVMTALMADLHIDAATGGWLMSAFAVAGIVLGIPAALMLGKFGPKLSGTLALGCTLLGSIVGALANNAGLLLFGRAIEGVGLGLIAVVAPAVISMWFAPHERGTPMGIWASWVPVGSFIMYNLAGPLLGSFGWQGSWWFGAAFALVALIIYAVTVSAPASTSVSNAHPAPVNASFGKLLFNPASWILALMFGAFNFAFIAYATWAPTYFNQGLGVRSEHGEFRCESVESVRDSGNDHRGPGARSGEEPPPRLDRDLRADGYSFVVEFSTGQRQRDCALHVGARFSWRLHPDGYVHART